MATCVLVRKSDLDILIESGDKEKIGEMIRMKEAALKNASENMEYWTGRGMPEHEFCMNEKGRVELLEKQLSKLREVI